MINVSDIYSFNNVVYKTYLFYVCVLSLKVLVMAFMTGRLRHKKNVFANPEDAKMNNVKGVKTDEDVERVRRAHRNDLENIPFFILVCGAYLLTNPSVVLATNLIRIYTAARIIHTLVYAVIVIPQPARGIAFGVGMLITIYMALATLISFIFYL